MCLWVFPDGPVVKEPACNARDMGLIPGLRRSPEVGNGNPLQYSFWEIPGTEGPGGLQSTGSQRGGHNLVTEHIHRHANQCVSTLFRKNHGNLRAKLYFDSTPACGDVWGPVICAHLRPLGLDDMVPVLQWLTGLVIKVYLDVKYRGFERKSQN